jgi:hypothetical protein
MTTANIEHSKRKHSKFAASSAKRWLNCPGSVRLSEKAPPQFESIYAKEGTDAHECLEFLVRRYVNLLIAMNEAKKKWPEEMVEHAVNAAHLIHELRPSKDSKMLIETRVSLKHISPKMFGTLDYAWVDDWGDLVVIDFKYGVGVVNPLEDDGQPNPQLMYYAAGLLQKYGDGFGSLKLAIIQPRVFGDSPLKVADVAISKIKEFEDQVRKAHTLAHRPDAPFKAGDWCKYCSAITICPENSQKQLVEAEIIFDIDDGIIANPEPLTLTAANLPKLLKAADQLELWIKAVREQAFNMATGGQKIPGYKLIEKRPTRVWTNDAEKVARVKFGQETYEQKMLSPAQLEKKFGAQGKDFTAKYTAAVSSGVNLVPESHKAPEAVTQIQFDLIGE